jgi:hypothetical protein
LVYISKWGDAIRIFRKDAGNQVLLASLVSSSLPNGLVIEARHNLTVIAEDPPFLAGLSLPERCRLLIRQETRITKP